MQQTLSVSIPIPDTHVLIEKTEYEDLQNLTLNPIWDMKDLKQNSRCHLMTRLKISCFTILNS